MENTPLIFLHTTAGNVDAFSELLRDSAPDVPSRHVLRDDLLKAAFAAGELTDEIRADTRDALKALAADNAGVVLCTCSTIGPGADDANESSEVPVLRVDKPMMEEALHTGLRIAVAATFSTTMGPTIDLLKKTAEETGKHPEIQECLFDEARAAFEAGDTERYMDIIAEGLREAAKTADIIVLAQASMAPAIARAGELPVPILSSPASGLKRAVEEWRARQDVV